MILGVLLPLGESLTNMASSGQDVRFVNYYLNHYCQKFDQVYLFSYKNERYSRLPKNCILVTPRLLIHRYFYGLLLPFIKLKQYKRCDVFRCFHPSATVPAVIGKLLFKKKFIFNYNYDYLKWARLERKSYLIPCLFLQQWFAFKLCDGAFVADEKMEKYAKRFVGSEKITLIRNGVDTSLFRFKKQRHKGKIILSVGRLEPQKNYSQLIKAVSGLKIKTRLIIVGHGNLRQKLIDMATQRHVDLKIIDMVPHDHLPQIYQSADVYVQPSLMEAPVKTLLEAMSSGLPCVATDVPGIRDVVQNGRDGLLAKLDVYDLKIKIEKLLSNRSLANRLGTAARKKVIEKYNLNKFLELETEILKSI